MISSVKLDGNTMVFLTSNSYAAELFNEKYAQNIRNLVAMVGDMPEVEVVFKYDDRIKEKIVIPPTQAKQETPKEEDNVEGQAGFALASSMPLREEYTFDEFVEGPSNSWAYSAAKGVVSHPGEKGYNPLFIHGNTGLGKTHLMQAIGNELIKSNKHCRVCYLTAEMFLNEYVNHMGKGLLTQFRDKYRNVDVLLVDDVQFFQKGRIVQEEFFNTFQYLQDKNKQIVMTCDVPPKNLPSLQDRLVSRFIGGMVQEIDSPSYETRLAILRKKAEFYNPPVPESALEFIAEKIKSHVRAMEGALAKVRVILQTVGSDQLSPVMLAHHLKDFIDNEQTLKKMTIEEIQSTVANKFNVKISDIVSSERTQTIVTPRQMAMYISRKYTSHSLEEIGRTFDKSHATILHGVKTIAKRIQVEPELNNMLNQILSEFGLKQEDERSL